MFETRLNSAHRGTSRKTHALGKNYFSPRYITYYYTENNKNNNNFFFVIHFHVYDKQGEPSRHTQLLTPITLYSVKSGKNNNKNV